MPDPVDPPGPRRRSILPVMLLLLAALIIGMGVMAWLVHRFDQVADVVEPAARISTPAPQPRPALVKILPPLAANAAGTGVDERIEIIERRVDDIGQRAAAAISDAHHAEGLLIAFAARRAIDRGAPLGYLEGVLREHFGGAEPQAVAMVISASRQPVTIDQLRDRLDALEPQLSSASPGENWWEGFRRELAGLIVIRKASTPSNAAVDRFGRARENLAAGHVDAALVEVARLPGRNAAEGWIADARRYVQTRAALDRIESAALLQPAEAE